MIRVTNIKRDWTLGSYIVKPTKPVKRKKSLSYRVAQSHGSICNIRIYYNPVSPVSERFYLLK